MASSSPASANFRKRRLSLPHLHLTTTCDESDEEQGHPDPPSSSPERMATLAAAAAGPAQFLPSANAAAAAAVYGYGDDAAPTTHAFLHDDEEEMDEKAHTFRKRRLSLTQQAKCHTDDADDDDNDGGDDDDDEDDASLPQAKRPRRRRRSSSVSSTTLSDTNGDASTHPHPHHTRTRIAHSTELLGNGHEPPPSPAVHAESVLYQKGTTLPAPNSNHYYYLEPPSLELPEASESNHHHHHQQHHDNDGNNHDDSPYNNNNNKNNSTWIQQLQPKWKRRMHLTDETKLPFSKSIVGTFSCHGVEPIFHEAAAADHHPQQNYDDPNHDQQNDHHVDDDHVHGEHHHAALLENDAWQPPPTKLNHHQNMKNNGDQKATTADDADTQPTLAVVVHPQPPVVTVIKQQQQQQQPTMVAKINQDRGGIAFPYGNSRTCALFAVYDGHGPGGELVSQYCLHEIQRRLERHGQFSRNVHQALTETFHAVDNDLRREPLIEPNYAGTTACVALLRDGELFLANSGDSRGVLGRKRRPRTNTSNGDTANINDNDEDDDKWDAIDLTVDQNPDSPGEKERILSMGGYISPSPGPGLSARVWLDPQWSQVGLAMGRSIGDHAVSAVGVICTPVISQHSIDLNAGDDFMILASDGVWEFISSQTAVDIVGQHLKLRNCATRACQALIEAAAARWHDEEGEYRDDITAIVVRLPELLRQQQQQQAPPLATNPENGINNATNV
jgi:protein phosphatase PTC2/3